MGRFLNLLSQFWRTLFCSFPIKNKRIFRRICSCKKLVRGEATVDGRVEGGGGRGVEAEEAEEEEGRDVCKRASGIDGTVGVVDKDNDDEEEAEGLIELTIGFGDIPVFFGEDGFVFGTVLDFGDPIFPVLRFMGEVCVRKDRE